MPKETRIWKVRDGHLSEVERQKLDLEERLEDWLEHDIAILSDDLLVILKTSGDRSWRSD